MGDRPLHESWDESEFQRMKSDGVDEYVVEFESGEERTTTFTAIAYFARLDPEAEVKT